MHGHVDPKALESHWLKTLKKDRERYPLSPLWVVTPTSRLRRRLQQAITQSVGSCLGISIFTPVALLREIGRGGGSPKSATAPRLVKRIMLRKALAASKEGRRLLVFKDGAASMEAAIEDLRETGQRGFETKEDLPAAETLLLTTYEKYIRLLENTTLEDDVQWSDRIARELSTNQSIPPVHLYGFGEFTGRNWRLLQSLIAATEVQGWFLLGGREEDDSPFPGMPLKTIKGKARRATSVAAYGARGIRAEMEEALNLALRWHRGGTPLEEIAIVGRSLRPLRPELGPLLHQTGLRGAVDAGIRIPLNLFPAARKFLNFAEANNSPDDFFDSGHGEEIAEETEKGLRAAWRAAETAQNHCKESLPSLLAEALEMEEVAPWERKDGGGLAILDFQQARGIPRTATIVTGLHHGSIPQSFSDTGFLSDTLRAKLNTALDFPIPNQEHQRASEHRMLEQVLHTPSERLTILRQQATSEGTSIATSPALRFSEEVIGQKLDFAPLPGLTVERAVRRVEQGAANPVEGAFSISSGAKASKDLGLLAKKSPPIKTLLGNGIEWLAIVDSFDSQNLSFDGQLEVALNENPAATRLEAYGFQPLAFFFEKILGVNRRAMSPIAGPDPAALGKEVHKVLQMAYKNKSPIEIRKAAQKSFKKRIAPLFTLRAEEAQESKALLDHLLRQCSSSINHFLDWDLNRLEEETKDSKIGGGPWRIDPELLETKIPIKINLGKGVELAFDVRADRVLRGEGTARVSDYKTGNISGVSDANDFLRGKKLQNALYVLGLESCEEFTDVLWSMEAVRISPKANYSATTATGGEFGSGTTAETWLRSREGVKETARILLSHLRQGTFPPYIRNKPVMDQWFSTMRLTHEPTLTRIKNHPSLKLLFQLEKKKYTAKDETSIFLLETRQEEE